jgi:hypothetical protein
VGANRGSVLNEHPGVSKLFEQDEHSRRSWQGGHAGLSLVNLVEGGGRSSRTILPDLGVGQFKSACRDISVFAISLLKAAASSAVSNGAAVIAPFAVKVTAR